MKRDLEGLTEGTFDLLVVGGGINGAGIARDAAGRGLRTGLVERDDFGSGTSGRSSKLIHGGLRYLEQGRLFQVRESLRERRTLLRVAPQVVRPLPFLLPIYRNGRLGPTRLRIGLALYDLLAGRDLPRHRFFGPEAADHLVPGLREEGLRGGALYTDAVTDDRRLTVLNVLDATRRGAVVANHAELTEVRADGDGLLRASLTDRRGGGRLEVRSRAVVNATGPWAEETARLFDGDAGPRMRPTRGAHIALPRCTGETALLFESPDDGRVVLAIPWAGLTLFGTTDTDDRSDPGTVTPTDEDIEYLLRAARHVLPEAPPPGERLLFAFAGIRPLVGHGTRTPSSVSRRSRIAPSRAFGPRFISILGGKLTSYRSLACSVVDRLARLPGMAEASASTTDVEPLPGGEPGDRGFARYLIDAPREAAARGIDLRTAVELVARHGTRWKAVVEAAAGDGALLERLCNHGTIRRAELALAAEEEMAITLSDALLGRTNVAFQPCQGLHCAADAADILGDRLGWDRSRRAAEVRAYRRRLRRERGARFVPEEPVPGDQ